MKRFSRLTRLSAGLTLGVLLFAPRVAFSEFDWTNGPWGIVISSNGTPGSIPCPVEFSGGTKTGNAIAVHYQLTPTHLPQLWAFLSDGFWRQASPEAPFLTSYRVFRFYSATNEPCDHPKAIRLSILGTNVAGELQIRATYRNDSTGLDDQFRIGADFTLERPTDLQSAMRANLVVSNASGHAVTPYWQGHRALAEQWVLFGVSSMYVADNLTGGLPPWYDGLDSAHRYVGVTNDAARLNDGYSVNGATDVSTHDVKYIVLPQQALALNHDTNACPIVVDPGYTWYDKLILLDAVASNLTVQHAYRSSRNHHVEVLECSGMSADTTNLKWSAQYNRDDTNMVDGDNVQIRLGLDDYLDTWPADAVQSVSLRLVTGNSAAVITNLQTATGTNTAVAWTTEPGEHYRVEWAPTLVSAWTNISASLAGTGSTSLATQPGFLRVVETNAP